MARKYLVWKDPACNGVGIEWVELTGREFYEMFKQPENRLRRFVKLQADAANRDDDTIIIEATLEQYIDWRKEKNRHYQQVIHGEGEVVLSMDAPTGESETDDLHGVVSDPKVNVERAALAHIAYEKLSKVIDAFTDEEVKMLIQHRIGKRPMASIAEELGVNRSTIKRRIDNLTKRIQQLIDLDD